MFKVHFLSYLKSYFIQPCEIKQQQKSKIKKQKQTANTTKQTAKNKNTPQKFGDFLTRRSPVCEKKAGRE